MGALPRFGQIESEDGMAGEPPELEEGPAVQREPMEADQRGKAAREPANEGDSRPGGGVGLPR